MQRDSFTSDIVATLKHDDKNRQMSKKRNFLSNIRGLVFHDYGRTYQKCVSIIYLSRDNVYKGNIRVYKGNRSNFASYSAVNTRHT